MVNQKFQNNKKSIFCFSHMFWGDTKLVFWESIGRSDCTSFSRIGLKISQMANLFVFIFLQKRVSEALTSLFVLFFRKINLSNKEFLRNLFKIPGISENKFIFWRKFLILCLRWKNSKKKSYLYSTNEFSYRFFHKSFINPSKITNLFQNSC